MNKTNTLNEQDILIFSVLYDYHGIKYVIDSAHNPERLLKMMSDFNDYLFNKKYSSINVQDENGNTFLHYASLVNNSKITSELLKNGADPFIKNNDGCNCFTFFKRSNHSHNNASHLHSVIKNFKINTLNDFSNFPLIHSNVKRKIFEEGLIEKVDMISSFLNLNYEDIKKTLKDNDLFNHQLLIQVLFNDYMLSNMSLTTVLNKNAHALSNVDNIKKLLQENLTAAEKTTILTTTLQQYHKIIQRLDDKNSEDITNTLLDFIKNSDFENNSEFKNSFYGLHVSDDNRAKLRHKIFILNYAEIMFNRISNENIEIDDPNKHFYIEKAIENNSEVRSVYDYLKMTKNLSKTEAYNKKVSKI